MTLNKQLPEKFTNSSDMLDVVDVFRTIQGEGPLSGRPATFIRLAGCNLQCPWCDTDYTSKRKLMDIDEVVDNVLATTEPGRAVVLTGGEPLRQKATIGLCNELTYENYRVQIETNGTLPLDIGMERLEMDVWVVISPKTGRVHASLFDHPLVAMKYVLDADNVGDDGLPEHVLGMESRTARPPLGFKGDVFLQPADHHDLDINQRHIDAVVQSCMKHGYRLCLQTHKIVGLP